MAKLTNVRERVHQPFRDSLIRSSGWYVSQLSDRADLFTTAGKDSGSTNLKQGSVLPSDQSMVVLALRVFAWYRNPIWRGEYLAAPVNGTSIPSNNGDFFIGTVNGSDNSAAATTILNGNAPGSIQDVHRLYFQTEEQLLWSFGAGDKFSLQSMPTYYFPAGGGLHGQIPDAAGCGSCTVVVGPAQSSPYTVLLSVKSIGECCTGTWHVEWVAGSTQYHWDVTITDGGGNQYDFTDQGYVQGDINTVVVTIDPCVEITIDVTDGANVEQFDVISSGGGGGGCGELILWNNGMPSHESILRLARAVLIPPRQNIKCSSEVVAYANGGNSAAFGLPQGSRNLLSLTDNLNVADGINKIVSFVFDGLFSRDVQ